MRLILKNYIQSFKYQYFQEIKTLHTLTVNKKDVTFSETVIIVHFSNIIPSVSFCYSFNTYVNICFMYFCDRETQVQ